ncbi:PA2778 family cysteine peptidase [Seleniivibrio woodruffii]|uniref:PA2778 family cysteine peptidase n=1 Tax=Seleniivibrio woodruffii TaxID=1078050 RepID=UPI0026EA12D0|nr:PA2778 family cysteine peptidase [Seleniivibrio woodruffii]
MIKQLLLPLCLFLIMTGCAAKVSSRWDSVISKQQDIALSVPFYAQKDYYCGPSSLAMMLEQSGIKADPDELAKKVFTPSKKGSFKEDMLTGARRSGRIPYPVTSPADLYSSLREDKPVLVFMNMGLDFYPVWHYAVVTGIGDGYLLLHSGVTPNEKFRTATFDKVWARGGYWGFILLRPGEILNDADPVKLADAAFAYSLTDADGAIETLKNAYDEFDSKPVMFAYANALYAAGKKTESMDIFRSITEKYPDDGDGWNNLAHVLNETGLKKLALYAAEKAVSIGGNNLSVYEETLKSVQTP